MLHELESWDAASFVTLTYDDEHLPADQALDKRELQLWVKRLREAISPRRLRYYACGEYGERTFRAHYHAILFGVGPRERELVRDSWGLGFVKVGTVSADSIRYVADYIGKALLGAAGEAVYGGRTLPFQIRSLGLGREFCDRHGERLRSDLGTTIRGKPIGLPRYYFKRLGLRTTDKEVFAQSIERKGVLAELYQERAEKRGTNMGTERDRSLAQHARNIDARASLRKRDPDERRR